MYLIIAASIVAVGGVICACIIGKSFKQRKFCANIACKFHSSLSGQCCHECPSADATGECAAFTPKKDDDWYA